MTSYPVPHPPRAKTPFQRGAGRRIGRPANGGGPSGNHTAGAKNHVGVQMSKKGTIARPNKSITISKKTTP